MTKPTQQELEDAILGCYQLRALAPQDSEVLKWIEAVLCYATGEPHALFAAEQIDRLRDFGRRERERLVALGAGPDTCGAVTASLT